MKTQIYKSLAVVLLWGVFIASLVMTLILGGADGINASVGGLLLQFIGTIYWGDRIRKKRSLFIRFWVDNESPKWERIFFGGAALGAITAGQHFVFLELFH